MFSAVLPVDERLSDRSRLRDPTSMVSTSAWVEVPFLLLMGLSAAALTGFVHLRMRVPGHVILFGVVPMMCGLAVAPRRRAGSLMSLTSALVLGGAAAAGTSPLKLAAITSLGVLGPALDWAARRASHGKTLYLSFALAGLASNAVAFAAQMLAKQAGAASPASRPFAEWMSSAPVSFAICGLLAGLIGAGLFFQFSGAACPRPPDESP